MEADYIVDEKAHTATLTAKGIAAAEKYFRLENLAEIDNATLAHHINQAIKAHGVMKRDIDYVVADGEVMIVDEFTGRLMPGRRYNEGLHQALEAKEQLEVQQENKTYATITYQNYFRLYTKLSGMTGTAATEREEFQSIYGLDIVEIPTNKPVQRVDHDDVVFKTENGKDKAIVRQIKECYERGQPVLVGTVSIEKSEQLHKLLKKERIPHRVLNAKHHDKEATIIAQAGKPKAVTIATNMAGRGTDIMLGGNAAYMATTRMKQDGYSDELIAAAEGYADTDDETILNARSVYRNLVEQFRKETERDAEAVRNAGGLFIIGTERHDSRRIDNQLRGRSGRQGDPGESRFYLALSDSVMRLYGGTRIEKMFDSLGFEEDDPVEHTMLTSSIEQSQKNVESLHFRSRKATLEFDDVMNIQRNIIYDQRRRVLNGENVKDSICGMIHDVIAEAIGNEPVETQEELNTRISALQFMFADTNKPVLTEAMHADVAAAWLCELADAIYNRREEEFGEHIFGAPVMREVERIVLLRTVDEFWMEHIDAMDDMRRGIGLRGYGNIKPIDAFKQEGFAMFENMVSGIRNEVARRMYTVQLRSQQNAIKVSAVKK